MALNIRNCFFRPVTALVLFSALIASAVADVLHIRDDAPETYVVKKGDTLWDISSIFLEQPWLWPELWRNNTQIENPHLIYPGDVLTLRWENGVPVLEVIRDKNRLVLSPDQSLTRKERPIDVLPWALIDAYLGDDQLIAPEVYEALPFIFGDRSASPRFAESEYLLSERAESGYDQFHIVRIQREVKDTLGKSVGYQVDKIGSAKVRQDTINNKQIIEVTESDLEVRQGDKLVPAINTERRDITLQPADRQRGELIQNSNGNSLIGRYDVVIVNLGSRLVQPGTVFGIYEKGKDIKVTEKSVANGKQRSVFDLISLTQTIEQPAYKVGELIVVKTFEEGSYALVTKAQTHLKGGEIIAKP